MYLSFHITKRPQFQRLFQLLIINYNHHQQTTPNLYFSIHKISSHSNQSVLLLNPSFPPPFHLQLVERTKFSNCFTRQLNKHGRVPASIILPRFLTVARDKSVLVTVLHFEKLRREKNRGIFLIPPFFRGRDVSTKKKKKKK